MEENSEETSVKIEIEMVPHEDENDNLLRVLHESESMVVEEPIVCLQEMGSDMLCDSNSQDVNLAVSSQVEGDHRALSSAASGDNSMEASQNTRDDCSQNGVLNKYTDMSVEVSIDRISSLEGSASNTVDNTKSPFPGTSSQPVSSDSLKSVLEELRAATGRPMDDAIKSPSLGDIRSELSHYLHSKLSSSGSDKLRGRAISVVKPPTYKDNKHEKVELYAPDIGPRIYTVKGNIVTPPIIVKNLPEVFRALPVHGKAEKKSDINKLYRQKIRDYVGYGISNDEFKKLEKFCSPDYLKTDNELQMPSSFPAPGVVPSDLLRDPVKTGPGANLCIVKKLRLRIQKDKNNHYPRRLKYRGLRLLPLTQENEEEPNETSDTMSTNAPEEDEDGPLEPGRDLIIRVRLYRPHAYGTKLLKPNRHSVFNNDIVLLGRHKLTMLRDRIGCPNDIGMRIDMSEDPDAYITESAKRVFPSGFLFINNVFYVDRRPGCSDQSGGIRDWARRRRLGAFPVRDLHVRLDRLVLKLGHPEVYMHQGKCEHLFTFSEVRLLSPLDPVRPSSYPCHTAISQNQSVYCTTCAEFGAKWVVVGCSRVPFDPAFFCETCFKLYLYDKDAKKIGDFKAYSYKVNTVNFLKPYRSYPEGEYEMAQEDEGPGVQCEVALECEETLDEQV